MGSEPFGKFSTLLDSSTAYKNADLSRYDPFCRILNMELLQFYYSASSDKDPADRVGERPRTRSVVNESNGDIFNNCPPQLREQNGLHQKRSLTPASSEPSVVMSHWPQPKLSRTSPNTAAQQRP